MTTQSQLPHPLLVWCFYSWLYLFKKLFFFLNLIQHSPSSEFLVVHSAFVCSLSFPRNNYCQFNFLFSTITFLLICMHCIWIRFLKGRETATQNWFLPFVQRLVNPAEFVINQTYLLLLIAWSSLKHICIKERSRISLITCKVCFQILGKLYFQAGAPHLKQGGEDLVNVSLCSLQATHMALQYMFFSNCAATLLLYLNISYISKSIMQT